MDKRSIEKELGEIDKRKEILLEELRKLERRTLIECQYSVYGKGCEKKFQICDVIYIQTHSYVSPYGCTEGDYWIRDEEGNFIYPSCGLRNRLFNKKEYEKLSDYFKEIRKEYER